MRTFITTVAVIAALATSPALAKDYLILNPETTGSVTAIDALSIRTVGDSVREADLLIILLDEDFPPDATFGARERLRVRFDCRSPRYITVRKELFYDHEETPETTQDLADETLLANPANWKTSDSGTAIEGARQVVCDAGNKTLGQIIEAPNDIEFQILMTQLHGMQSLMDETPPQ